MTACLNCGKPLKHETHRDYHGKPMWNEDGSRNPFARVNSHDAPGYRGNGFFCTMRCGFSWAVRKASR